MSLAELIEAALGITDLLRDNRPPITPAAKATETWPTESRYDRDPVHQPFQGHPVPLGGDL